ncbi:unnamed protein product [Acanthoscelides obtectus]|uniref:Uncharacterized protein n=1 Tax=Acanthoscelides obtectus TaxID=200917 RepID=A0A9P0NYC3_ACAOB|nr:unnamed protein product [Acanthoscelides obtectus]
MDRHVGLFLPWDHSGRISFRRTGPSWPKNGIQTMFPVLSMFCFICGIKKI